MIEITIKVQDLLLAMGFLCFAAAAVNAFTDDTSPSTRFGHWCAKIGEMVLLLAMILVTAGWMK